MKAKAVVSSPHWRPGSEFKVKVVLKALRQDKTLNQIASEHDLHSPLVQIWKQALVAATPQLFDQPKGAEKPVVNETGTLYEQIGRLQPGGRCHGIDLTEKKLATNP